MDSAMIKTLSRVKSEYSVPHRHLTVGRTVPRSISSADGQSIRGSRVSRSAQSGIRGNTAPEIRNGRPSTSQSASLRPDSVGSVGGLNGCLPIPLERPKMRSNNGLPSISTSPRDRLPLEEGFGDPSVITPWLAEPLTRPSTSSLLSNDPQHNRQETKPEAYFSSLDGNDLLECLRKSLQDLAYSCQNELAEYVLGAEKIYEGIFREIVRQLRVHSGKRATVLEHVWDGMINNQRMILERQGEMSQKLNIHGVEIAQYAHRLSDEQKSKAQIRAELTHEIQEMHTKYTEELKKQESRLQGEVTELKEEVRELEVEVASLLEARASLERTHFEFVGQTQEKLSLVDDEEKKKQHFLNSLSIIMTPVKSRGSRDATGSTKDAVASYFQSVNNAAFTTSTSQSDGAAKSHQLLAPVGDPNEPGLDRRERRRRSVVSSLSTQEQLLADVRSQVNAYETMREQLLQANAKLAELQELYDRLTRKNVETNEYNRVLKERLEKRKHEGEDLSSLNHRLTIELRQARMELEKMNSAMHDFAAESAMSKTDTQRAMQMLQRVRTEVRVEQEFRRARQKPGQDVETQTGGCVPDNCVQTQTQILSASAATQTGDDGRTKKPLSSADIVKNDKQTRLSDRFLIKLTMQVLVEKMKADAIDDRENNARQPILEFISDFLLNQYGLRSLAEKHYRNFVANLQSYSGSVQRMYRMATLCGFGPVKLPDSACDVFLDTVRDAILGGEKPFPENETAQINSQNLLASIEKRANLLGLNWPEMQQALVPMCVYVERLQMSRLDLERALDVLFAAWEKKVVTAESEASKKAPASAFAHIFKLADDNGDGVLEVGEWRDIMKKLLPNAPDRTILMLYRRTLDESGTGSDVMTPEGFDKVMQSLNLDPDEAMKNVLAAG